ncbi:MAG: hypothetical protein J6S82_07815 [Bacteroidales bacterium]|nr:hypothetical protein [Bacteroidales bacterium]
MAVCRNRAAENDCKCQLFHGAQVLKISRGKDTKKNNVPGGKTGEKHGWNGKNSRVPFRIEIIVTFAFL